MQQSFAISEQKYYLCAIKALSMTETGPTVMSEREGGTSGAITCVRPELLEVQCFM